MRARRAADWVGGSVFVSVVVVLGSELALAARSDEGSCASDAGAWAMMAGMDGEAPRAASAPQSVESTPRDTDCLVVVAGVSVGGSVDGEASAKPGPWWFVRGAWKKDTGVASRLLSGRESAAESGIVGFFYWTAVNAWPLCPQSNLVDGASGLHM